MKTLSVLTALAALTLTASTTCAAVIDLSNPLGPSGGYSTEAYYQGLLGGQPMTAAQQTYANQEDQLRLQGFLSELGGDFALGQMFYQIAYGITPPAPASALNSTSAGSDLSPPSSVPSGPVIGASDIYTGAGATGASDVLNAYSGNTGSTGTVPVMAVPEELTWAMMAIGFVGFGFTGWRSSRKAVVRAA